MSAGESGASVCGGAAHAAAAERPARVFRRVIRIALGQEPGGPAEARAVVEDDYHHFRVSILHDGRKVTGRRTQDLRKPFTLCGVAGQRLQALVGMPLSGDVMDSFRRIDARQQCTHQLDIAALAIAAAARGTRQRRYDIAVPLHAGRFVAELRRDGQEILSWEMLDEQITAPALFRGLGIGAGFSGWVAKHLNAEDAEAALVLRRGAFLSVGRREDEPMLAMATPSGVCWVHQPVRHTQALGIADSVVNFSDVPERLTADDEQWIRFADASGAPN